MEQNKTQIERLIDKFFTAGSIISHEIPGRSGTPETISFEILSIDAQDNYTMQLKMLNDNYYYSNSEVVDYGLVLNTDGMYAWRHDNEPAMYVYFEMKDFPDDFISFGS